MTTSASSVNELLYVSNTSSLDNCELMSLASTTETSLGEGGSQVAGGIGVSRRQRGLPLSGRDKDSRSDMDRTVLTHAIPVLCQLADHVLI
jgi:hypothetical protein